MTKLDINQYRPCSDAVEFYENYETSQEAWENCPRGDWMLWIAAKLLVDIRTLTLAKALCAKTVIHLMKDERSIKAVEVAEAFGKGNATREELDAAYADADAADSDAYYTDSAADAAATAAYATAADSDAADSDTDAAAAAAAAYYYTDSAAARVKNQKQTAEICREILTEAVFEKISHEKGLLS